MPDSVQPIAHEGFGTPPRRAGDITDSRTSLPHAIETRSLQGSHSTAVTRPVCYDDTFTKD